LDSGVEDLTHANRVKEATKNISEQIQRFRRV